MAKSHESNGDATAVLAPGEVRLVIVKRNNDVVQVCVDASQCTVGCPKLEGVDHEVELDLEAAAARVHERGGEPAG